MAVNAVNPSANNAVFYLNQADAAHSKSIKRLSSGNRLEDDAAGIAVSGKLDLLSRVECVDRMRLLHSLESQKIPGVGVTDVSAF